jgi:tetratricopeptide (TPR) repeat protein
MKLRNPSILILFLAAGLALFAASCVRTKSPEEVGREFRPKPPAPLDSLNRMIATDSLNPDLYHSRAKYYLGREDINEALSDMGRAIQINDRSPAYYVTLSDIYLAAGSMPNCLDALKKAEELDPAYNDALLKLAEAYLILKDYKTAFAYTQKALDLERINPVAHFIRGYTFLEVGDTTLAIKNFQAAADQDQNYYKAYVELGIIYTLQKNPLATGYFEAAVKIDSKRPEALYLLGMAYQESENVQKALEAYDKLMDISPNFKEAYYNSGYICLVYLEEFPRAIKFFTHAINLDSEYTDAYFNRGYAYELSGDEINARKDYLKAMEITPNYQRAIEGLNRLDNF